MSDAHAHGKFVAHSDAASVLFAAAVIDDGDSIGYARLDGTKTAATSFVEACRQLRAWDRNAG